METAVDITGDDTASGTEQCVVLRVFTAGDYQCNIKWRNISFKML